MLRHCPDTGKWIVYDSFQCSSWQFDTKEQAKACADRMNKYYDTCSRADDYHL